MLLQLYTLLQLHYYMFATYTATEFSSTAMDTATCLLCVLLQILVALLGILLHALVAFISWAATATGFGSLIARAC